METIKKVIYFDESTAIDFLQIESGGKLTRTTELVNSKNGEANGSAQAKVELGKDSVMKILFDKFLGANASLSSELSLSGTMQGEKLAKTILENTLLSDFIDTVEFRKRKYLVDITDEYRLKIEKDSMSYFAMIAPISEMLEGSQSVEGMDNMSMSFSKFNSGLRSIKGYFELLGYNKENQIERIFRFNINSFKNNYRIQDLTKMNLTLYSLRVGEASLEDLKFEAQFNLQSNSGLSFSGVGKQPETGVKTKSYPVYDVILAGVK